ncbi:MAG: Hsp20/alpha crystallin family protein [bacterium]
MSIVRYKPISLFDDIFEDFWNFKPVSYDRNMFTPLGDVIETEKEYNIDLMLPGIKKDDIKIKIEDGKISIEGERKENKENKFNHKETWFGKFKKTYVLPDDINVDNVDASYEDGILKVKIPKDTEKIKSKLIEVK